MKEDHKEPTFGDASRGVGTSGLSVEDAVRLSQRQLESIWNTAPRVGPEDPAERGVEIIRAVVAYLGRGNGPWDYYRFERYNNLEGRLLRTTTGHSRETHPEAKKLRLMIAAEIYAQRTAAGRAPLLPHMRCGLCDGLGASRILDGYVVCYHCLPKHPKDGPPVLRPPLLAPPLSAYPPEEYPQLYDGSLAWLPEPYASMVPSVDTSAKWLRGSAECWRNDSEPKSQMSLKDALESASQQVEKSPDWLKTIYKRNDTLLQQRRRAYGGEEEPAK